jgi:hypothetical protein
MVKEIIITDVEKEFKSLLGEDFLKLVTHYNWVSYEKRVFRNWECNEILIKFLEKDSVGDTVSFCEVVYNLDKQTWYSWNCVDEEDYSFRTWNGMATHLNKLEKELREWGNSVVTLPLQTSKQ